MSTWISPGETRADGWVLHHRCVFFLTSNRARWEAPAFLCPPHDNHHPPPQEGDQPKGSLPTGVLVRRPILLSRAWLVFLIWIFATAAKITLPPLPAFKGHVPGINPESLRPAPWLGIADGTNTEQKHRSAGCVLPVLDIPWPGVPPAPGSMSSVS